MCFHESVGMGGEMVKAVIAVGGLAVSLSIAIVIGSQLASGRGDVELTSGVRISPYEIMLKFDATQPPDDIKDFI